MSTREDLDFSTEKKKKKKKSFTCVDACDIILQNNFINTHKTLRKHKEYCFDYVKNMAKMGCLKITYDYGRGRIDLPFVNPELIAAYLIKKLEGRGFKVKKTPMGKLLIDCSPGMEAAMRSYLYSRRKEEKIKAKEEKDIKNLLNDMQEFLNAKVPNLEEAMKNNKDNMRLKKKQA